MGDPIFADCYNRAGFWSGRVGTSSAFFLLPPKANQLFADFLGKGMTSGKEHSRK
jgi:hypothetical protein